MAESHLSPSNGYREAAAADLREPQSRLKKLEQRLIGVAAASAALAPGAAFAGATLDTDTQGKLALFNQRLLDLTTMVSDIHQDLELKALDLGVILQASGGDDKEKVPPQVVASILGLS